MKNNRTGGKKRQGKGRRTDGRTAEAARPSFLRAHAGRIVLIVLSLLVIAAHFILRGQRAACVWLTEHAVHPVHRFLARVTGWLPFSVAECLLYAAILGGLVWLIVQILRLVTRPQRGRRLGSMLVTLAAAGLSVYAGLCFLWGGTYYAETFAEKAGITAGKISAEQLENVTRYFRDRVNETAGQVPRDADGVCATDKKAVLARSAAFYDALTEEYPFLAGPRVRVKGMSPVLSLIESYAGYTGFFFPFTGEANVNTDMPPALFAATAAHEIAHQRGVAREEEANFVAVLAGQASGDPELEYSSSLMAFIYLSNALYRADQAAWSQVSAGLCEEARADIGHDAEYWEKFEGPVRETADQAYDEFLHHYDQELGLQSYGACVDLLAAYYGPRAGQAEGE